MTDQAIEKRASVTGWITYILAGIFYLYEYLLRISPTVMIEDLQQAFQVDAAQLGLLSAFYLYAYAPMQIPVGLLMDRFGARRLLTLASLSCGLGGVLFGIAPALWLADVGRIFMGLGSAFAFVGICCVSRSYFSLSRTAILIGFGNSFGMLGAIGGEGPLAMLVNTVGWRATSIGMGIFGFILAALIFWAIRLTPQRRHPRQTEGLRPFPLGIGLLRVCKNPYTWVNAIVALCLYAVTSVFASLWGVPFLQTAHGLSKATAGFTISLIFVGWLFGGPLIGLFSDRLRQWRSILIGTGIATFIALLPVIYLSNLSGLWTGVLLFLIGLLSSSQLLCFTVAVSINDPRATGIAAALTNAIVAASASLLQPFVGFLLDLSGGKHDQPVFTIADYRFALTTFPVLVLIGVVLAFFLKDKPWKPIKENV